MHENFNIPLEPFHFMSCLMLPFSPMNQPCRLTSIVLDGPKKALRWEQHSGFSNIFFCRVQHWKKFYDHQRWSSKIIQPEKIRHVRNLMAAVGGSSWTRRRGSGPKAFLQKLQMRYQLWQQAWYLLCKVITQTGLTVAYRPWLSEWTAVGLDCLIK